MRKTLGISLLVMLLTVPAVAGEMPYGSPTPPPPSDPQVDVLLNETSLSSQPTGETTADGWMGDDAAASLTQSALELLAVMPALF